MKLHLRRAPGTDPARATTRTRIRVVCWSCEHEWDADKRAGDAACFVCDADGSGEGESHTIDRRTP